MSPGGKLSLRRQGSLNEGRGVGWGGGGGKRMGEGEMEGKRMGREGEMERGDGWELKEGQRREKGRK